MKADEYSVTASSVSSLLLLDSAEERSRSRSSGMVMGPPGFYSAAAERWESTATFLLAVITCWCWRTVRWDVGEQEQWSRAPQP